MTHLRIILLSVIFICSPGTQAAPIIEKLKRASEITVTLPDKSEKVVKEGDEIPYGTTIKVPKRATVVVVLDNGFSLALPSKSRMLITRQDGAKGEDNPAVELYGGMVRAFSEEKEKTSLRVRTQSAVAGVRGTDFTVQLLDGGETEIRTLDGEVEVAENIDALKSGKGQRLKRGQYLRRRARMKDSPRVRKFDRQKFKDSVGSRFSGMKNIRSETRDRVRKKGSNNREMQFLKN